MPTQSRQKYAKQRRRGAEMQHHEEGQEFGRMLVDMPAEEASAG